MKLFAATLALCSLAAAVGAEAQQRNPRVAPPDMQAITPPLAAYTDDVLFGDVWKRTELAPRDRSLVTVAALIAGGHTQQMTGHFNRALDNGVKPAEIAAVITHLAFYAGWPRAVSAVGVAKDVFAKRGIATDALARPQASFCPSIRPATRRARPPSRRRWAARRRRSPATPTACCSAICGGGPTSRRATAAW